jgi:rhamnulokinase
MSERSVLAVDLGAESGRVMKAAFDGQGISLSELHRFSNTPVYAGGSRYWDVLRLWHNIQLGIEQGKAEALSVAVDTWGVDFALLDRDGTLISNPVHYRDKRNNGMMEWVFERVPRREIFEQTGIQFMQINGLYGLASLLKENSPLLDATATLLTIPDLFNYWLSASRTCEFTHATTLQMVNPRKNDWAYEMLKGIGFATQFLPPLVYPGDRIGEYEGLEVIVPACHDTGSAVVGIPTTNRNYAYLSSGTWSLLGIEVDEPIINDAAYEANLTNEGGVYGNFRLLKNIMGLWLAQQCRETWLAQGHDYSYAELVSLAQAAPAFASLVDPDHSMFLAHGDMPSRISAYCQTTNQNSPETIGAVMRCVYESLALKYRHVVELLKRVSGQAIDCLHIIGGGSQNELLCQMSANALGIPIIAGPSEATALGNAVIQFISHGDLGNLSQAREMLSRSIPTRHYEPENTVLWDEHYQRFLAILDGVSS